MVRERVVSFVGSFLVEVLVKNIEGSEAVDAAPGHLHLLLAVVQKYFGLTDQFQLAGEGLPGEAQLLITDLEGLSHEEVLELFSVIVAHSPH